MLLLHRVLLPSLVLEVLLVAVLWLWVLFRLQMQIEGHHQKRPLLVLLLLLLVDVVEVVEVAAARRLLAGRRIVVSLVQSNMLAPLLLPLAADRKVYMHGRTGPSTLRVGAPDRCW